MLCQNCNKRTANVHFTKVVNDKKIELYLCEQCAREKGQINLGTAYDLGTPMNIVDFFPGFVGYNLNSPYISQLHKVKKCTGCGMSRDDFQETGKLGCSECYKTFKEQISPLIKRIHGVAKHQGKVPPKFLRKVNATREIQRLKEELNKAVLNEEYEKAALLRDKIREFECKEKGGTV